MNRHLNGDEWREHIRCDLRELSKEVHDVRRESAYQSLKSILLATCTEGLGQDYVKAVSCDSHTRTFYTD